jgi:Uma2 family endonuclease
MITALDPSIRRYRLSVEDLERMLATGIVEGDAPVELLAGELLTTSSQGPEHAAVVELLAERLRRAVGPDAHVRDQLPLVCGEDSQPEADVVVVRGAMTDYRDRHPRSDEVILVVEVALTAQALAHRKRSIYARTRIPEYWIIDLVSRCATIHGDLDDGDYALVESLDETQSLTLPDGSTWPLRALLP